MPDPNSHPTPSQQQHLARFEPNLLSHVARRDSGGRKADSPDGTAVNVRAPVASTPANEFREELLSELTWLPCEVKIDGANSSLPMVSVRGHRLQLELAPSLTARKTWRVTEQLRGWDPLPFVTEQPILPDEELAAVTRRILHGR